MAEPGVQQRLLSVEEYIDFELASPVRHEYVGGMIYALSGVTRRHSRIAGNIFLRLAAAAGDGPCRLHLAEVRLRIGEIHYYPDITVACGAEPEDPYIEDAPCLLVEVTSPSTEAIDRREKLMIYRQIPSLRAYLIVDQEERRVERHWRDEAEEWQYAAVAGDGAVPIPCPEMTLPLDEIYARLA
ncbi:MAG: Uma2 family endonuclease [Gemmatimonadetes bacterium]|nr:Uma2 family endonuclease [Gemmatimonadota bacterium]